MKTSTDSGATYGLAALALSALTLVAVLLIALKVYKKQ